MIAIIKNDWRRLRANQSKLILVILLTIILVPAIFGFNFHLSPSIHLQVNEKINVSTLNSANVIIEKVKEAPKISKLISGQIDAYIKMEDNEFNIMTARNQEFKDKLLLALTTDNMVTENNNLNQINEIKSFKLILFFSLFIGMVFSFIISEDKEKQVLSRLFTTKLNLINYLLGHFVFIFINVFCLMGIGLIEVHLFMPNVITLNIIEQSILIGTASLLSASLSLFFSSHFATNDTAMMFGQFSIILLSLLSGTFYSFNADNKIIDNLLAFLPIKQMNVLINNLFEFENNSWRSVFIIIIMVLCLLITTVKPLKKYGGIIR